MKRESRFAPAADDSANLASAADPQDNGSTRITLDIYAQARMEGKRKAQLRVQVSARSEDGGLSGPMALSILHILVFHS